MSSSPGTGDLTDVQVKLFRLARAARARNEAVQGAAVVDETGRTSSAASVELPSLQLSALQMAVATAAASGARALTAAVVVGDQNLLDPADVATFNDLADAGATIVLCAKDQRIVALWEAS